MKFGRLKRLGLAAVAVLLVAAGGPPAHASSQPVKGTTVIPCPEPNGQMFSFARKTSDNKAGVWFRQPCDGFGWVEWGIKKTKKDPAQHVSIVTSRGDYSWDTKTLKAFGAAGTPMPTKAEYMRGDCCTFSRHHYDKKKPDYLLTDDGALIPWKTAKGAFFDTFRPGNTFSCCSGRSATTPNQGNPPADDDLAQAFEVPGGRKVTLQGLDLGLSLFAGPNMFELYLTKTKPMSHDWGGFREEPDLSPAGIVESWSPTGVLKPTPWSGGPTPDFVVHLDSVAKPKLEAGQRYWVVLSVSEPDSRVTWYAGSRPEGPVYSGERDSANSNQWEANGPSTGGYALRVTAR